MKRNERGATILEGMIAMAVLTIGLLGLLAAQVTAANQNGAAVRKARAVAVAQDVLSCVRRWQYTDARIANGVSNDDVIVATGGLSGALDESTVDVTLNVDPAASNTVDPPLSLVELDYNRDGAPDYRRYILTSDLKDRENTVIGRTIRVVVTWTDAGRWQAVTMATAKYDPTQNNATIAGL